MKTDSALFKALARITGRRAANDAGYSRREIRRSMRELEAYSDRELEELGISRGGIREAVTNGRPGIDRPYAA